MCAPYCVKNFPAIPDPRAYINWYQRQLWSNCLDWMCWCGKMTLALMFSANLICHNWLCPNQSRVRLDKRDLEIAGKKWVDHQTRLHESLLVRLFLFLVFGPNEERKGILSVETRRVGYSSWMLFALPCSIYLIEGLVRRDDTMTVATIDGCVMGC